MRDGGEDFADLADNAKRPARTRRQWRKVWRRTLLGLIVIYAVYALAMFSLQDRMLFPASRASRAVVSPAPPQVEVLKIDLARGGQSYAWFIPAPAAVGAASVDVNERSPVVIFFHGNAELIEQKAWIAQDYNRLGVSVLLPEYPGYGRADVQPSKASIEDACVKFYDLLASRDDVDATRIVFHGFSLGAAVAASVAEQRRPAALILQSTFTSTDDLAHHMLLPGFLVRHDYETDRVVQELGVPLLIFHGNQDRLVPVWHGRRLHELAAGSQYVEYACGHNSLPPPHDERDYWEHIAGFLKRAGLIGE